MLITNEEILQDINSRFEENLLTVFDKLIVSF